MANRLRASVDVTLRDTRRYKTTFLLQIVQALLASALVCKLLSAHGTIQLAMACLTVVQTEVLAREH